MIPCPQIKYPYNIRDFECPLCGGEMKVRFDPRCYNCDLYLFIEEDEDLGILENGWFWKGMNFKTNEELLRAFKLRSFL